MKKLVLLILVVLLASTVYAITPGTICGDVNGDGRVDVLDALAAAQISAGIETLQGPTAACADVTGSGNGVDVLDALLISQISAGLPVKGICPAGCPDQSKPQCSDGLDNDGDMRVDFEAVTPLGGTPDYGCDSIHDDEERFDPACGDGIDNDGDSRIDGGDDYLQDFGCTNYYDTSEDNQLCQTIERNGDPANKINVFFYEDGYNSNKSGYFSRVNHLMAKLVGGEPFSGVYFPGTDPFNAHRDEFNFYTYADFQNPFDGLFPVPGYQYGDIEQDLIQECPDFQLDNYNLGLVVTSNTTWWVSGSRSTDISQRSQGIMTVGDNLTKWVMFPTYGDYGKVIAHEIAHYIGFFDDEYDSAAWYLGGLPFLPNIDSASCTQWCQGVDVTSQCYQDYQTIFLDCFRDDFIAQNPTMQQALAQHGLNYTQGYDWFGTCFDHDHYMSCGVPIMSELISLISDPQWEQAWANCRNPGPLDCNIGLQCQQNQECSVRWGKGTFKQWSFNPPNQVSIMENSFYISSEFPPSSRDALVANILAKNHSKEIHMLPY